MIERISQDHEIELLESIHTHSDHVRQRDLARIAGLSLGMTNAIVKRLVQKGWLTVRKVNNRNIRYAVSPEGIEEISRRSYSYFKRTVKNIVYYRESIETFVREVKAQGHSTVRLVGKSDLDFIVEHACARYGIRFVNDGANEGDSRCFVLYSEVFALGVDEGAPTEGRAFLRSLLREPSGIEETESDSPSRTGVL